MKKLIGICLLASVSAFGSANLLTNGGFEDPVVGSGGYAVFNGGSGAITGWQVVGAQVLIVDTDYSEVQYGVNPFNSSEGRQYLDLTGAGNNGTTSGVSQTFATVQGTEYTVSWMGCVSYTSNGSSPYTHESVVDLSVNGGARVSYINNNSSTPGMNNWQSYSATFVATATTSSVTFFNGYGGSDNNNIGIDDVQVNAVPEPASMAVLALGGLVLLRRRKRG